MGFLTLGALIVAFLAPRVLRLPTSEPAMERVASGLRRYGPLAAGLLSVALIWWVWGAVSPVARVQDERAYLLQADIFARGRWTAPSPPIPEFFEQPHVQVVPSVASKYPPGHSLLLTPGALVGFHALVPLLLTGLTAALIFGLAARIANVWVAVLTWVFWVTAPQVLRFQPSYLSELTTTPLLLGGWWCLLNWRETRNPRWLYLLSLAVGWSAITRPLTALALAVPIGVVVIRDTVRLGAWRAFAVACGLGILVLSILPLWNQRTTGDWRLAPVEKYRQDYIPFDKMGFDLDTTPPKRALPLPLQKTAGYLRDAHLRQTLADLPATISSRVFTLASAFFHGARVPLLLFAAVGLFVIPVAVQVAVLSALSLFLAYLGWVHWGTWIVYYLEATPVVAVVTAFGLWTACRRLTRNDAQARVGVALVSVVIIAFAVPFVLDWRSHHIKNTSGPRWVTTAVNELAKPSIVFVRYAPQNRQHIDVVVNYPDLSRAPVWVVHDLGARNDELRRLAPDRHVHYLQEAPQPPAR